MTLRKVIGDYPKHRMRQFGKSYHNGEFHPWGSRLDLFMFTKKKVCTFPPITAASQEI